MNPAAWLQDFSALHFLRPWWLGALLLLPLLAWWWRRRQRERSAWRDWSTRISCRGCWSRMAIAAVARASGLPCSPM